MPHLNRREFLGASAAAALAAKPRLGLVQSSHRKLPHPASPEDPLDYERVRDMVWKAIEYGRPRAGSLEAKIRPGSWVVIKPNIVSLRPMRGYRTGDITDMRVTKAVIEYVARRSRAARITVAEGGSYRRPNDPAADSVTRQNGVHVDAATFDWGHEEFPGWAGSLSGMLSEFGAAFPNRKFDYIDLSYDAVRDPSGAFRRIEVPRTARGVGAFSLRPDYFVTNTIRNCDFLINVPVMKVHFHCGITVCLKNYVGTAPREAYATPGGFSNTLLHRDHSVEDRIDPFIADLAAFHPPDYNVVDALRGLQHQEHNNGRPDQMVRTNAILAGEDTVAADALAAYLMGFNPGDIDFLHMAAQREMGVLDLDRAGVAGDDPASLLRTWSKPRGWYGRCNRQWRVTRDPAAPLASWQPYAAPTDTLDLARSCGSPPAPGTTYAAAARVRAATHLKGFLWVGLRGLLTASLNGETVMEEENRTRYRIGQFQKPVELRPGDNLLVFRVQPLSEEARLSLLLVGPRNDGDSLDGIRWLS